MIIRTIFIIDFLDNYLKKFPNKIIMLEYFLLLIGIFLLIKGADYLVDGSSSLAKKLGVSSLVVGLTVVAFGTSMPELIVNVLAAINGNTEVAFGNIIGSNIANTLLILGITALIVSIPVHKRTAWREIPFSILAVGVLFILSNDFLIDGVNTFSLTRIDGIILLLFFLIFIYYTFITAKSEGVSDAIDEFTTKKSIFYVVLGIIGLYLGGKWTVDSAVIIAKNLGVSEFLISATVIALGTSLPELVTSVKAARKKHIDMAVGNVVGSNIFNIFWILGFTSVINPVPIPKFINADLIVLFSSSLLLFGILYLGKRHVIQKWQGGLFLGFYLLYVFFLIFRG